MTGTKKFLRICGCLLLGLCFLAVGSVTWAYLIEPKMLIIRPVEYQVPTWSVDTKPIKILVAGDFHFANHDADEERAIRYVEKINEIDADYVFFLGDFMFASHGKPCAMPPEKIINIFDRLKQKSNVYLVQGNHDRLFSWGKFRTELKKIGINVLENNSTLIPLPQNRHLQIAGLRDSWRHNARHVPKRHATNIPYIVLVHRPQLPQALPDRNYDFIISGHTHGGQICPPFGLNFVSPRTIADRKYTYPWHKDGKNLYLITKGLGMSQLPFRFNCPPEMYLLTLKGGKN